MDGTFVDSTKDIPEDTQIGVILDKTNFYAEQGGQEYDTGKIVIDGKTEFEVENVKPTPATFYTLVTSSMVNLLLAIKSLLVTTNLEDGPSETITLVPIFSTLLSRRFSVTVLTKGFSCQL